MMTFVAAFLLALYCAFFVYIIQEVIKGRVQRVFLYSVIFLPVYSLFLIIIYSGFGSQILVKLIQYSKELIIFGAFLFWVLGQRILVNKKWNISRLDWLFISFLGLAFFFFAIGLGDATVVNRAIYLKNILLIGIFYFFGRNVKMDFKDWNTAVKVVLIMTVFACVLAICERLTSTHFHSLIGYSNYYLDIAGEEPAGSYGLGWTFEAEGGKPRYGAFFAHPLELSASMLLVVAIGVIYLVSMRYRENKYRYLAVLTCSFICLVLAYSRASFVSFFLMMAFMAFLLRYYQILKVGFVTFFIVGIYIVFFAGNEILYFVLDTISFENSSSVTHMIDWLNAVDSMISSPMGIGLAMSGNAGGVEKDLIVGGENQYLIYGVQMGFLGMFLYIGMLFSGIRHSWKAYRLVRTREEGVIPFVAASVKFGMLLPLFTANAEAYIYISLVSWWLIGHGETVYQEINSVSKRGLFTGQIELSK